MGRSYSGELPGFRTHDSWVAREMKREFLVLVCLIVAAAGALFLFREGIGIAVFLAICVATVVQLARVVSGSGKSGTLERLWGAFKDAFWGIG